MPFFITPKVFKRYTVKYINSDSILTDQLLIQALQNGNRQAFTEMVEAYQHMVFNAVLNIVQQFEEAEDVAQEVFIQVFQNIKQFRGESKFSTWLYRIAITEALDLERKKKARKRINLFKHAIGIGEKEKESISDFHHPGIAFDNKEMAAVLHKALQKIPENQRMAFILIKAEGLSYNEVGEILQVSIKAVESLMHRAKENLRKILHNYYSQTI